MAGELSEDIYWCVIYYGDNRESKVRKRYTLVDAYLYCRAHECDSGVDHIDLIRWQGPPPDKPYPSPIRVFRCRRPIERRFQQPPEESQEQVKRDLQKLHDQLQEDLHRQQGPRECPYGANSWVAFLLGGYLTTDFKPGGPILYGASEQEIAFEAGPAPGAVPVKAPWCQPRNTPFYSPKPIPAAVPRGEGDCKSFANSIADGINATLKSLGGTGASPGIYPPTALELNVFIQRVRSLLDALAAIIDLFGCHPTWVTALQAVAKTVRILAETTPASAIKDALVDAVFSIGQQTYYLGVDIDNFLHGVETIQGQPITPRPHVPFP